MLSILSENWILIKSLSFKYPSKYGYTRTNREGDNNNKAIKRNYSEFWVSISHLVGLKRILLLFTPSPSTRLQKLMIWYFPEHPFFVGPRTRLPLKLLTLTSKILLPCLDFRCISLRIVYGIKQRAKSINWNWIYIAIMLLDEQDSQLQHCLWFIWLMVQLFLD